MHHSCLKCEKEGIPRPFLVRSGFYYRTSDSQKIQRFRCPRCRCGFSQALFQGAYRQKKRHKNQLLRKLLCSGVSQRRAARILNIHRTTVVRKFLLLSLEARFLFQTQHSRSPKATQIEFDDLETFEHTKCKPISVTLAVEFKTRRILGLEVSRMAAKGLLVRRARKYGYRRDERRRGRRRLFKKLQKLVSDTLEIKSDSNPHYPEDVAAFFPKAVHRTFLGKRGAITGQGELKKVRFDPLFSLNHTCAKLRADVNRLFRRTWCTTKRLERLQEHLILYAAYHNEHLKPQI